MLHRVLLTFDDGPDPVYTVPVLDELARRGVRAVFFVQGNKLEEPRNRAVAERAAGEGHAIGNHTYSHQRLTQLPEGEIRAEIQSTEVLIGNLDRGVKLWRPPFGDRDVRVDAVIAALGYTRMLWNVDSLDWRPDQQPAAWVDQTLQRIQWRISHGFRNSVCVLHDAYPAASAGLRRLLDSLGQLPDVQIAWYDPSHPDGLSVPGDAAPPRGLRIFPPDATSFRLGDSLAVARAGINAIYVLNQAGGQLWEDLAGGASETEAARNLARDYEISEDLAARDVATALADWRVRGLLGPKPPELEDPGPWPHSFERGSPRCPNCEVERAYRFLDVSFRIRYERADLAAAIHPRFANLEAPENGPVDRVFDMVSSAADGASAGVLAYGLFFELVRMAHPKLDPMACLHSSLVGSGEGAVALAGNNGSGKSTLAAGLASAGFRILSDDRVFLDFATRRPASAPNSVSLKRGSWSPLLARLPTLLQLPIVASEGEELRFFPAPPPTEHLLPPVTHLFFPRYDAAATTAAISLTATQAIERIGDSGGWISSDPEKLGRFLQWIQELRCYELPYSNLDRAISCIEEHLRG